MLLLDLGNTRWKWMIREGGSLPRVGAVECGDYDALHLSLVQEALPFSEVRVSSVADRARTEQLERWCREQLGLSPVVAAVSKHWRGLEVAYDAPESLGVDRWLAMLAARSRGVGDCVVVDAGSAITVDYILASGRHEGGLIAPGLGLMNNALYRQTSAVKVKRPKLVKDWQFGRDTSQCVEGGLGAVVAGFLRQVLSRVSDDTQIIITGGDGMVLAQWLPESAVFVEHLVLEGLLCID